MSNILALISTSFIVISAIFIAFGWYYIRRGKIKTHTRLMISASIFATTFFIIYLSRTIFVGNTTFGGPAEVKTAYQLFLIFHIFLATTGGIMGIVSLYLGFKKRFAVHKKVGPWTSILWFMTAITGVAVYMLLYVIYPSGETDSMLKTILGF
jgi:putative membrane protein